MGQCEVTATARLMVLYACQMRVQCSMQCNKDDGVRVLRAPSVVCDAELFHCVSVHHQQQCRCCEVCRLQQKEG